MKTSLRVLMLVALAGTVLLAAGCNKLRARDQLNKGVASYKNAQYEQAIEHFKNAVTLDPSLQNAKIYLATAYLAQYIPGVDSPDNVQNANAAIDQYKAVLQEDPKNVNSIKGIAYLYLQMKRFEDAKAYYHKAIELDPNDPEAYYSIGVIDWTQAYQPRQEARAKLGLRPDEPLKDKKVCQQLRDQDEKVIDDGIDALNKALSLRQDYDDAMAYMNLMYREKADRECDEPDQRAADLKTADEWVDKTMAAKKAKAEKQQGPGGITVGQQSK
ncbi:MAG TPA: tetratricopeptide repeat protein [Terriglobales bacterium]|nr:tetratricopeptide repeat protein [Terriglobales bacterium]